MSIKRFKRLLKVHELQENQAAVGLATRLTELGRQEEQYQQLENYLQLYLDAPVPNDIHQMKQMAFIRRNLRGAMEQQAVRVTTAQAHADQARAVWLMRHRDSQSLTKLIERQRAADTIVDNRRQQFEQDAWATRRAFERLHAEQTADSVLES